MNEQDTPDHLGSSRCEPQRIADRAPSALASQYTEDEREAIGYALNRAIRELRGTTDDHSLNLLARLQSAADKNEGNAQ